VHVLTLTMNERRFEEGNAPCGRLPNGAGNLIEMIRPAGKASERVSDGHRAANGLATTPLIIRTNVARH
jgi:hypothetical protein